MNILIDTWIRYQTHALRPNREDDFWAVMRLNDICEDNPQDGFRIILAILDRDTSHTTMGILSAGPLEELLVRHGELVIELVEFEAKYDPDFASLLGGVWQNGMSDELYARVQKVWDRRGWDD